MMDPFEPTESRHATDRDEPAPGTNGSPDDSHGEPSGQVQQGLWQFPNEPASEPGRQPESDPVLAPVDTEDPLFQSTSADPAVGPTAPTEPTEPTEPTGLAAPAFWQPTWAATPAPLPPLRAPRPSLVPVVVASLIAGLIGGVAGFALADGTRIATDTNGAISLPVAPGMGSERAEGSIAAIAAAVLPTVVNIEVVTAGADGTGSGSIIQSNADGSYILTNNHVIASAANGGTITVTFQDRSRTSARIVGRDPSYDLAVLRIDRGNLPVLPIGDSGDVVVGDSVVAIGSPLGLSGTVTSGIVSALNRAVTAGGRGEASYISAIQTDAAINPGNSGGPLVDAAGRMIGINSAIATLSAGETGSIGLGFAIPMKQARRVVEEIIRTGRSTIPVIGVQLDNRFTGRGAQVLEVDAGGPAQQAGLRSGDIITGVNGVPVENPTEAIVSIRSNAPGDAVTITIRRGGSEEVVEMILGSRPSIQQ
jgi:putative serine protease PepD